MRSGIFARTGRWNPPENENGFVAATRQKQFRHPPDF